MFFSPTAFQFAYETRKKWLLDLFVKFIQEQQAFQAFGILLYAATKQCLVLFVISNNLFITNSDIHSFKIINRNLCKQGKTLPITQKTAHFNRIPIFNKLH